MIDPQSLQTGLVHRRRGGYCFQQNGLFRLVLGRRFRGDSRAKPGCVTGPTGSCRPRTHMVLVVASEGQEWLADVGFGAEGLIEPIVIGAPPCEQEGWRYRTVAEGRLQVLQREGDGLGRTYISPSRRSIPWTTRWAIGSPARIPTVHSSAA